MRLKRLYQRHKGLIKIVQNQQLISTNLEGEEVILNLQSGMYYGLDKTGTFIWEMIHKPMSVTSVVSILQQRYTISREVCMKDTLAFLGKLLDKGLINLQLP